MAENEPVKVIVVNGPNLGRLGVRQPDVYGRQDLEQLRRLCTQWAQELGLDVDVRQTDDEAQTVAVINCFLKLGGNAVINFSVCKASHGMSCRNCFGERHKNHLLYNRFTGAADRLGKHP